MKYQGLCFRCEERAQVMEGKHGSRCECNEKDHSSVACYMYKPVKPVTLTPLRGYEKRPRINISALCAREQGVEVADCDLKVKGGHKNKYITLYWEPKEYKKKRSIKTR